MYIAGFNISYDRPVTTLLRHDGAEYPGGTIVNKLKIPYETSINQIQTRSDNTTAMAEIGRRQGRCDGFILDVFNEDAVALIKSDIGRVNTKGYFILQRPNLKYVGAGGRYYYIRFYAADFAPQTEVRSTSRIQYHRADIQPSPHPIEILGMEVY